MGRRVFGACDEPWTGEGEGADFRFGSGGFLVGGVESGGGVFLGGFGFGEEFFGFGDGFVGFFRDGGGALQICFNVFDGHLGLFHGGVGVGELFFGGFEFGVGVFLLGG